MSYDLLAKNIAGTLSGVFGAQDLLYARVGISSFDVAGIIRKDVEELDDSGQFVSRVTKIIIARNDIAIIPKRGDTLTEQSTGTTVYTVGKRLKDDGYTYHLEVTS